MQWEEVYYTAKESRVEENNQQRSLIMSYSLPVVVL